MYRILKLPALSLWRESSPLFRGFFVLYHQEGAFVLGQITINPIPAPPQGLSSDKQIEKIQKYLPKSLTKIIFAQRDEIGAAQVGSQNMKHQI